MIHCIIGEKIQAMDFKVIELSDRDIFLKYIGETMSFYNFTNICMWRRLMDYRYAITDNCLVISDCYMDEERKFFYPMCYGTASDERIKRILSELKYEIGQNISIRPLSHENAEKIKNMFPECEIIEHRDLFDYVYKASDLINLSGRRYHSKKNHFNSFVNSYDYKYIQINSDNLTLLREASDKLYTDNGDIILQYEHDAVAELLNNFSFLELEAAVITVGDNIAAYTIGERISDDTALIHVEKADRAFSGSYAAINRMFIQNAFPDVSYVNREEDMGIEGLRRAKLSYHPHHFNEVYEAII